MFLVYGVEFELWCVAERESGLRARHHNAYRENLVGKRCSGYTEHTTGIVLVLMHHLHGN